MKLITTILIFFLLLFSCSEPCDAIVCQNEGVCMEGICDCPEGYIGTFCETEERAKFFGKWSGTLTCDSGTDMYMILEISDGVGIHELNVGLLAGLLPTLGTISGDSFSYDLTIEDTLRHYGSCTIEDSGLRAVMNIPTSVGGQSVLETNCTGVLD